VLWPVAGLVQPLAEEPEVVLGQAPARIDVVQQGGDRMMGAHPFLVGRGDGA
jgi:hypothetical protein